MRTVVDRIDLLKLVNELELTGNGVELGVAAGRYSWQILSHTNLSKLYSVDRWSDHHGDAQCRQARVLLSRWHSRSEVLRATFDEALLLYDDNEFDFIYIDGYAHTGQEGGKTLDDWWPKAKSGAVFGGHDYDKEWPKTIEQVDRFVKEHKLDLHVTGEQSRKGWYKSWFVIK